MFEFPQDCNPPGPLRDDQSISGWFSVVEQEIAKGVSWIAAPNGQGITLAAIILWMMSE